MAITTTDVWFWKQLKARGHLPPKPTVLEIGEANWYGDYSPSRLIDEIAAERPDVVQWLMAQQGGKWMPFYLADAFYRWMLDYSRRDAWDLHGTPSARKLDLNWPVDNLLKVKEVPPTEHGFGYDIVIDTGTCEHIFNIAQAMKTIHDFTTPGGIMTHCFPFRGWFDHGFYAINPTFVNDLAKVNGYELLQCCLGMPHGELWMQLSHPLHDAHELARQGELPDEALMYVAWRKSRITAQGYSDFKIPMQGVYADGADANLVRDWRELR